MWGDVFFDERDRPRLWTLPLLFALGLVVCYVGLQIITFVFVIIGAEGAYDPFWNAPLKWLKELKELLASS